MIVSHLLFILHSFISLCLKPEMWQKVAKFKGAEYFRKALYMSFKNPRFLLQFTSWIEMELTLSLTMGGRELDWHYYAMAYTPGQGYSTLTLRGQSLLVFCPT